MKTKKKTTTPPKSPSTPTPNSKQKRIPRTMGVTMLMKEYKETNNRSLLTRAQRLTIDSWANNNYTLNGIPVDLNSMSHYTKMNANRIMQTIVKPMQLWLSGNTVEDRFEALVSFITKNGLATRAQLQDHLALLREGQRNTKTGELEYTPFVSSAVTNALDLILKSDSNFLKIVEMLKPTRPSTAIQINSANGNPHSPNGQFLGVNEAVKLLNAQSKDNLLDSPDMQAKLLAEHTSEDLPEIIATRQQGISIDGSTKTITKRDHTQRREADGPIYDDVIIP